MGGIRKSVWWLSILAALAGCMGGDETGESTLAIVDEGQCLPDIRNLIAGQHIDAGSVSITADEDNLYVTIDGDNGWMIKAYHIYAGTGTPGSAPGQYPYKGTLASPVDNITVTIPLPAGIECGDALTIAVHTETVRIVNGVQVDSQTGWGEGPNRFPRAWGMYFTYTLCCEPPPPPPELGCVRIKGSWRETPDLWPVDSMTLGGVEYDKAALVDLLYTLPGAGDDASMRLAHQLIAAKLNEADGAFVDAVTAADMAAADAWLAANADADGLLPFYTDAANAAFASGMALTDSLLAFNSGERESPSCVPQWR